jgi:hypothetical protein
MNEASDLDPTLPEPPKLLTRTQRRLWRLIAAPEGVRTALAEEQGNEPLALLVRGDERLCAEDRLDVYANAYFYRILDVLRDDFPTLAASLGESAFHDLATSYLAIHPSEHPSLRWIGRRLSGFLRHGSAAGGVRRSWPWAADLAALEWAMSEAFDAANAPGAQAEPLARLAPQEWGSLQLALRPDVRLLQLAWPVHTLCVAERNRRPHPAIAPEATALCIWRREERVFHRTLDPLEAEALGAIAGGSPFGALCEQLAEQLGDAEAPARAAGWLARWIGDGLLLPFASPL